MLKSAVLGSFCMENNQKYTVGRMAHMLAHTHAHANTPSCMHVHIHAHTHTQSAMQTADFESLVSHSASAAKGNDKKHLRLEIKDLITVF